MIPRLVLAAAAAWCMTRPAMAVESCPAPYVLSVSPDMLPATRAAVARHDLTILAFGGAAAMGAAAHGVEYAYPARLGVRLRDMLPGVNIKILTIPVPPGITHELIAELDDELRTMRPALVVWGPGGSAAAHGDDMDTFDALLKGVVQSIQQSGADMFLMTLQFAPSVALLLNLPPYREAVLQQAEEAKAAVFDRYEFMRFWSETGFLNLDATDPGERVKVARRLYDCLAEVLAGGIVNAVR